MNNKPQSQMQKNEDTIKLGDIAEVKEIFLHEVRAEDLIISSTLEYMGERNKNLRPVMTVYDRLEYLAEKRWMCEEIGCLSPQYFEFSFEGETLSTKKLTTIEPEGGGDILRALVHVLRLNEKGLDTFLPEFIQMELIEKIPRKLWDCLDEDLGKNLLSVEIRQTKIEDQIKAIRDEHPPRYENDFTWTEYEEGEFICEKNMILDHNNIKGINYALEILGAPSIKLKKFADTLKQYELIYLTHYLDDLNNQIEKYHDDFRFLLLEENSIDKYIEKHLVDKGMSSEDKKNACARQKYELQSKAIDSMDKFEVFQSKYAIYENASWEGDYFQLTPSQFIVDIVVNLRLRRAFPKGSTLLLRELLKRKEAQLEESRIRAEEKERIMRILSHEIKGLLSSQVIDPLQLMQTRGIGDADVIDDALRGARLLKEMVNAINLSLRQTRADFDADLCSQDEKGMTLSAIFFGALKSACSNMFDNRNFNRYFVVHFSEEDAYYKAREAYMDIEENDIERLIAFCQDHLGIKVQMNWTDKVGSIRIGNHMNSALKLLILFQELFQNAVKHATFAKLGTRYIRFSAHHENGKVIFETSNAYSETDDPVDTRIGNEIITLFIRQFDAVIEKQVRNNGMYEYRFTINFNPTPINEELK